MKKVFSLLLVMAALRATAQPEKIARAFPITDYMLEMNDSTHLVQVYLPNGPVLVEKQMGLLQGKYRQTAADTIQLGSGRCQLIKKDYYYFTIGRKKSMPQPREEDLLYVLVPKTDVYTVLLVKLAAHYIELDNVYDEPFYDRTTIFQQWTAADEKAAIDSMVNDIHFTGNYFLQNNPDQNVLITSGDFSGKRALEVMTQCTAAQLSNFLKYIVARPRMYAGSKWKITEIFATWLTSGAPTPVADN